MRGVQHLIPNIQYPKPNLPRATRYVLCALVVALFIVDGASVVRAQERVTLALLPFDNVSGSVKSLSIMMPLIEQALREKGYWMVSRERLEAFLFRNRIRNTGMLSRKHVNSLRKEFGVELAMVGSVDLFHESEENPQWGLSSRILSTKDGRIRWAHSAGLTGDDFTGIFGLGTIRSSDRLAEEVVNVLLRDLPPAGDPFPIPERARSSGTAVYRSPVLDSTPPRRVAVLPFENGSDRRGAGRILTDVFTTALFQHGSFEVMDPGEVSEALTALKATPYGLIDFATLAGLRTRIGVDAVILGTVYTYNEGLKRGATTAPDVSLDARMLDAESGRILWYVTRGKSGDDYQVVLRFGVIRSMVPLAFRVVTEMLESL